MNDYNFKCAGCGRDVGIQETCYWDAIYKQAYCIACGIQKNNELRKDKAGDAK